MVRNSAQFICQQCEAIHSKWAGQCSDCLAWNTLLQEVTSESIPRGLDRRKGQIIDFVSLEGDLTKIPRLISSMNEFDRVCGGGLVSGSALLVGGDPGVGKSTLLLQVAAKLSSYAHCAYISGEEAIDQLRMRANRLNISEAPVSLATAISVRDIVATLDKSTGPQVVIIDSIQTMYVDSVNSVPGSVSQVRASAHELIRQAKQRGFCIILVGHVTKDGAIAGPRILEHMVDTVLYFEGERSHQFRILRSVKNRYGATDEIGVFEMGNAGLVEVENPSALFLADHKEEISGAAVFAGIEGTRPMLLEIQSLIATTQLASPRRAIVGWDTNRLAMIIAVLDSKCDLTLGTSDVYLNVAGGLKISEPAADLAVAAALLSSLIDVPLPLETVFFGEIGLSGEIRPVAQSDLRLKEASKLGFKKVIMPPKRNNSGEIINGLPLNITHVSHVTELLKKFELELKGEQISTSNQK